MEIHTAGYFLVNRPLFCPRSLSTFVCQKSRYDVDPHGSWCGCQRLNPWFQALTVKFPFSQFGSRVNSIPMGLQEYSSAQSRTEGYSRDKEVNANNPTEEILEKPPTNDQINSLLADTERTKLAQKLSEANQQNRFLKRQLYAKEEALASFKRELGVLELEVQALLSLTEEIAQSGIPGGSRKINGKYIQSHLFSRLKAAHDKLKEQIKDVAAVQSKEVLLSWYGVAESVQVMGSFDGWSQGEHLSPEYTGLYTRFSTTLMVRPGRYEIKFMVDGEWKLSPEFPTVGEGLMENNLLIVE